jgi:hypothetical protein
MNRLAIFILVLLAATFANAQSFEQYLLLRKQYKITAPAKVEALDSFVGSKVLEIQGVVKGSFRVGDRAALMLESPGGGTITVDSDVAPEWLMGNATPARLLIKATRSSEGASLGASLIAVAPESQMKRFDDEQLAKHKAALAAQSRAKKSRTDSSGLWGPIGRGHYERFSPPAKSARQWSLPSSEVTPIYASFIKKQNPRLADGEAVRIAQGIVGFSLEYGVDARLIMAMVMVESGFDPNAVSRTGAMGLGQLMPGTAEWMKVQNPYDSIDNLYGTVKLIRTHLDQYKAQTGKDFDALVLSLAAYNAGMGAVRRAGGVPNYRETQNYVRRVIGLYYQLAGA